jgi:hypothetical protein
MKQKNLLITAIAIILIFILIWFLFFRTPSKPIHDIVISDGSGMEKTEFQLNESIVFQANNLEPRTGYNIRIVREDGYVVNNLGLSTDEFGIIPETIIWYDIGILPCQDISKLVPFDTHMSAIEISDTSFIGKKYSLSIIKNEKIVSAMNFHVTDFLTRPILYAASARGCVKSGFLIGEEDVWVVGRNFPKESIIRLWAVKKDPQWKDGTQLEDKTKQYDSWMPPVFELRADETGFMKTLWPKNLTSLGSYDIVAEVISYDERGKYHPTTQAKVQDIVSYLTYSGFVIQRRPGAAEPLEFEIAGSVQSPFAFKNTFLTTENVYVGVDPCIQPTYVGQSAKVYIVADKTDAQWTVDHSLNDVTGFVETLTVGGICGNCWKVLAWTNPLIIGKYDVVLDFNQDGVYTPGVDLIDGLDKVGFTVSEIRVNSISFNYSGSGAVTIYDNIQKVNITAPEYYSAGHIIKQAAWTMGGSHTVQVNLKAVPSISTAQIWAETGLGGLNSSGSPVTVSFSGGDGTATFTVNSNPNAIGKNLFYWNWKYKNVNGSSTSTSEMGATGEHILFTTYATPTAPMTTPWLEALEYSTNWASGQTTQAGVVSSLVNGIYNSGMIYDGGGHHTSGVTTFNLTGVFDELRTISPVYMDCRDCANFYHVLANAIGFNYQYLRIPGGFTYNQILPMGQATCISGNWNYHQVGWCGSDVADGSAKLTCTILSVCNYSAAAYISLLTSTSGITAGSTGICSPY